MQNVPVCDLSSDITFHFCLVYLQFFLLKKSQNIVTRGGNNNNDLLTGPLGGSSLLNYIDYNYKINRIKLFTNYTVEWQ